MAVKTEIGLTGYEQHLGVGLMGIVTAETVSALYGGMDDPVRKAALIVTLEAEAGNLL